MNSYIKINEIIKNNDRLEIKFNLSDNLEKFFIKKNFWIEYNFNIEEIPDSILSIPLISNILPILWITNSELIIDEIDNEFFKSIDKFKKGYIEMYPDIKFFETKINYNRIISNEIEKEKEKVGAFFSGGVDAYATLFSHIQEKPILITVWGADVDTNNEYGWKKMKDLVEKASSQYSLEKQFIKSNFKEFLNTKELNKLIIKSGDGWWHGFQHGIGLISLAAPISYYEKLSKIYIASSYTINDKATCASHPNIDENIHFTNTNIYHDQYELNRQMKVEKIVDISNKINKYPYLHVCWENTNGKNCCKCEKCCRTMIAIMIANDDPIKYGFNKCNGKYLKNRMKMFNKVDKILFPLWNDMKEAYKRGKKDNNFSNEISWIEKYDIEKQNLIVKKIFRKVEKIIEK